MLSFRENQIGEQGAGHLAEALKINQVIVLCVFRSRSDSWSFTQTLIVLDLGKNEIEEEGAEHIAEALKINKVIILSFSL
jgi:hypothetical protein